MEELKNMLSDTNKILLDMKETMERIYHCLSEISEFDLSLEETNSTLKKIEKNTKECNEWLETIGRNN